MKRREFIASTVAGSVAAWSGLGEALSEVSPGRNTWQRDFDMALETKPWLGTIKGVQHNLASTQLRVNGTIPKGLSGTLYRNGPAKHEVQGQRYHHLFDGDGMVQAFNIDGDTQTASHLGRFVETEKHLVETQQQKIIRPAFGTDMPQMEQLVSGDQGNTANINVLNHAGKTMALWEGGSAYEIHPESLATKGKIHWSKETQGLPFSAHPRKDKDGSLWNFGAVGVFNGVLIYHIAPNGALKRQHVITLPKAHMIHDFMVTGKHLVFLLHPFTFNKQGRGSYLHRHEWRAKEATRIMLVDKSDLNSQKFFEMPANWVFHFGNAWEENGLLRFDMCSYKDPRIMTESLTHIMRGDDRFSHSTDHINVTLNTRNGAVHMDKLYQNVEFPVFDSRYTGHRNRYSLVICNHQAKSFRMPQRLALLDLIDGRHRVYDFPKSEVIEEFQFVPRSENAREMEGWLLGPSFDYERQISRLNIFDAQKISDGPVGVIDMPYIVPAGFHGTFVRA